MANSLGRVCVTGATGKAGVATVLHLREHGYEVVATDIAVSSDDLAAGVLRADLTDYGQATEVLRGIDAVVHLANIPAPGIATPAVTFNANVSMNFNIFHAAAALGLSQGGVGVKRDDPRPAVRPRPGAGRPARPANSATPRSTRTISRSRRRPTPCRRSPARRSRSRSPAGPASRSWACASPTSWSPVTTGASPATGRTRTPASGTRGATSTSATSPPPAASAWKRTLPAASNVIIAAADTVMNRPSRDLLAEVFPDVPLTREVAEFGTLLSVDRAKQVIGYEPRPLLARRDRSGKHSS